MSKPEKMDGTTASSSKKSASPEQQSEVFHVGVKVPPFWPEKPGLWFSQIEAQFVMARITDDNTKYYHILSNLDRPTSLEVEDVLTDPPATNKYEKLKSELIKRLSTSSEQKVKQLLQSEELGDRKPSQFLRHLQRLAGRNIPESFIRTIWTSRLPSNLQTVIASQIKLPLNELADLADTVNDIAPSSPHVAAADAPSTQSALDRMAQGLLELSKQVSALTMEVHERSRPSRPRAKQTSQDKPRNRTPSQRTRSNYRRFPKCWYHFKFGNQALKCVKPCDHDAGNAQGDQ